MEQDTKNRVGLALMLIAIVLFAGGITFAFFRADVTGTQEKLTVTTGTLALTFVDNNTGITATELQLGEATSKEFSIENTGSLPVTTNMLWNNLINTYLKESMSYTFQYKTSADREWMPTPLASGNIPRSAIAQDFTLAENITIPVDATYYYKLTIRFNALDDVNQTVDKTARLTSNFKLGNAVTLTEADKTRVVLGKTAKTGNPTFTSAATTDETKDGLYSLADDYGNNSYYYRGAVTDNYVKFAGFYWRIIRVNGDGSLRMIYDGTTPHKNGENSTDRFTHINKAFNTVSNDNAYVGWMYGQTGQSGTDAYKNTHTNTNNAPIKDTVNTWYDQNLASYDEYIADAVYCNDRTIPGKSVTGWSPDTGLGFAKNPTGYGAFGRLVDGSVIGPKENPKPQFICPQKNDAFTVNDSIHGNAIGTIKSRKIGMITADEIIAAGGRFDKSDNSSNNTSYYLYKGSWYWSLSPSYVYTNGHAAILDVHENGAVNAPSANTSTSAVAPVISLKAEYARTMTGQGTTGSPFQIPGVE